MKPFPKNARVCFIGDSITHNNGYISHISAYYHENLKENNVSFYNCGVAGGRTSTILSIFDEDVLSHKPTHAVIMLGVNDSNRSFLLKPRTKERYDSLVNSFNEYKKNLAELCGKLKENNVEITLCTITPYNEYCDSEVSVVSGCYALTAGYAEYIRQYAKECGFGLCDYHTYITEQMQGADIYRPDRTHPNDEGQYLIAKCFLKTQGLEISESRELPEYMQKWCENVSLLRDIRATEWLVIQDYSLSDEERIKFIEKFVSEEHEPNEYLEYFMELSHIYLDAKPRQKALEEETNRLMEIEFKK
ncbi:MAG: hypothetical protein IJ366_02100 [Clostridia bacterium]|nr:hypothetical protein [Clostridia bacterium]